MRYSFIFGLLLCFQSITFEALANEFLTAKSERFITCPINLSTFDSAALARRYQGFESTDYASIDWPEKVASQWNALSEWGIAKSSGLSIVLIDIKRRKSIPQFFYFSNDSQDEIFAANGTAKLLVAVSALRMLRRASNGELGIDAKLGPFTFAQLSSLLFQSQNKTIKISSDAIATWMQNVAGRQNSTWLIHRWLRRPDSELLGGSFSQEWTPNSQTFVAPSGRKLQVFNGGTVTVNRLSLLTVAEFLNRLVHHEYLVKSESPFYAVPHLVRDDIEGLFYGSDTDKTFKGLAEANNRLITTLLGGEERLTKLTQGKFRLFQQSFPLTAYGAPRTLVSYVCIPQKRGGREFIIASRVTKSSMNRKKTRELMEDAYKKILKKIAPELIP